jgi:hypothetical protein
MLSRLASSALGLAALVLSGNARAVDAAAPGPDQRQVEAWLATKPASADLSKAPAAPEAPPLPPRRRGFAVESSIGAMGQLGALRHVTPTAPWFHAAFGWEATHWLMLLAQGDIALGSTSLANPPPEPRSFGLWGLSAAVRLGLQPSPAVGLYVQAEFGAARATEDALSAYGFKDANHVGPYFGGLLGVEWYQVSPHYALALQGGVRSYGQVLDRLVGNDTPLAWIGAGALKYTF